jgi:hypothetical protein
MQDEGGAMEQSNKAQLPKTYDQSMFKAAIPICSLLSSMRINMLLNSERHQQPKRLTRFGFKAYSQNDEDGIIQEIFNRIGVKHRSFIEFGCGHGLENNTTYLLLQGWSGLWMDGDKRNMQFVSEMFKPFLDKCLLRIKEVTVTLDNINGLLKDDVPEPDLLSIDVDMNDYWIWSAIQSITPRVVVIEYNATIRPPASLVVPYDAERQWTGTNYFGASLNALEQLGYSKGYRLVACNLTGINAFFVREDLVGDVFFAPYTAETHYQPPEYNLFQNYVITQHNVGPHPPGANIYLQRMGL